MMSLGMFRRLIPFVFLLSSLIFIFFVLLGRSNETFMSSLIDNEDIYPELKVMGTLQKLALSHKIKMTRKWIVVTSSKKPTKIIKQLVTLDEWTVVYVVTKDAPRPNDWFLERAYLLDERLQRELGFKLYPKLSDDLQSRKNIGYLFAIGNGAEWIYDADEDVAPMGNGLGEFDYGEVHRGMRFQRNELLKDHSLESRIFNPFQHFGRPDLYPRGFPVSSENRSSFVNNDENFRACHTMRSAQIQQGMIRNDPELRGLDGHQMSNDPVPEYFSDFAPPITLAPSTYAPFFTRNTLYHRNAFFTMFLPFNGDDGDLIRSYFAQKLLHLLGESIGFYPENGIYQGLHNLTDRKTDSKDSDKFARIVRFIDNWNCSHEKIELCAVDLAVQFSLQNFWSKQDEEAFMLWMEDLQEIRYTFPVKYEYNYLLGLRLLKNRMNCRRAHLQLYADRLDNQTEHNLIRAQKKLDDFAEILEWCDGRDENRTEIRFGLPSAETVAKAHLESAQLTGYQATVLIITNNFPWKGNIGLLQRLYAPYFAATIFCGTFNKEEQNVEGLPEMKYPVNFVHLEAEEMGTGYYVYYCLSKVRDLMITSAYGYVMMSDDLTFNLWHSIPLEEVVHPVGVSAEYDNTHWEMPYGQGANFKTLGIIKDRLLTDLDIRTAWTLYQIGAKKQGYMTKYNLTTPEELMLRPFGRSVSDFIYLPSKDFEYFAIMGDVFQEANFFSEIAFSKLLQTVPYVSTIYIYLWYSGERDMWQKYYSKNVLIFHPIKLSGLASNTTARKSFCSTVVKTFREILLEGSRNYSDVLKVYNPSTKSIFSYNTTDKY